MSNEDQEPFVSVEIQWGEILLPLNFNLSATIQDVKTQLADVTGIPIEKQVFKNMRFANTTVLASLDLSQPIILESREDDTPLSDIEEDEEEETFIGVQANLSTQEQFLTMLDPLRIEDFKQEFESKYESPIHPNFFTGTCQEAVSQCKTTYTPLIVYLHFEEDESTTPFCKNVLSNEGITKLVNENFLIWVGRMDAGLQALLKNFLGNTQAPFMVVVGTLGIGITILDIFQGLLTCDEYYSRLATQLETHRVTWTQLREDAKVRETERRLKEEQDDEYKRSLVVDEEKRLVREKEEEISRIEAEKLQSLMEAKERAKELSERGLPSEPAATDANATTIAIRLLDGTKIQRRFSKTDTLKHVYTFVRARMPPAVEEDPEFRLLSTFPRKTFEENEQTLQDAQLVPQAMLIVSELE